MTQEPEIYCPVCAYEPQPEDRWICYPGCGSEWHTFWTRGLCPGCGHQWQDTQCLTCEEMSPHKDWYHYPEVSGKSEERSIEKIETFSVE
jgi:hypothetical protein